MRKKYSYWFKPKKIGYVAAYYPVDPMGWLCTIFFAGALASSFASAYFMTVSLADALLVFFPIGLILVLLFDVVTLQTGQYPYWWRHHNR